MPLHAATCVESCDGALEKRIRERCRVATDLVDRSGVCDVIEERIGKQKRGGKRTVTTRMVLVA